MNNSDSQQYPTPPQQPENTPAQDIAHAREVHLRLQQSPSTTRLARDIQPILALAGLGLTFVTLLAVIMLSVFESEKLSDARDIVVYILGALTTMATQIISYYFGSSKGSADKNEALAARQQS